MSSTPPAALQHRDPVFIRRTLRASRVGYMLGHLPLPAKVTIRVLEPIDLRETYGADPDFEAVYDDVVGRMQTELSRLAADAGCPSSDENRHALSSEKPLDHR